MTIQEAHQGGMTKAHALYERLTGRTLSMHPARMFAWEKFLVVHGFAEADIELVVRYLQTQIREGHNYPAALWFRNTIEDPAKFEELLNDARAKKRNALPARTDKESVLCATGRCPPKKEQPIVSMNERVQWHLLQMRRAVDDNKTKS